MKTINGKKVNITGSGYLYVDGVRIYKNPITPLHVPSVEVTEDQLITDYAHSWAFKNFRMVQK